MHNLFSQDTLLPRIVNDTLYTSGGYKIAVDQEIKLGIGTRDNGDFKYITTSKDSWLTAARPIQASMRKSSDHRIAIVKKLKTEGNAKKGYTYNCYSMIRRF